MKKELFDNQLIDDVLDVVNGFLFSKKEIIYLACLLLEDYPKFRKFMDYLLRKYIFTKNPEFDDMNDRFLSIFLDVKFNEETFFLVKKEAKQKKITKVFTELKDWIIGRSKKELTDMFPTLFEVIKQNSNMPYSIEDLTKKDKERFINDILDIQKIFSLKGE